MQADYCALNVRHIIVSSGLVTTLAGSSGTSSYGASDGFRTAAQFSGPHDVAMDSVGTFAIVVR